MRTSHTISLFSAGGLLLLGGLAAAAAGPEAAASPLETATPGAREIHVIEHPGYFETRGDVFGIQPGELTFVVENRSGKDAGFVFAPEGGEAQSIGIANGETGRLEVRVDSGAYAYYCPIIPTGEYPLSVK